MEKTEEILKDLEELKKKAEAHEEKSENYYNLFEELVLLCKRHNFFEEETIEEIL
jgi:hypothetical protein